MKNNQKGFGVIGVALVVFVVGVIGASGWYVWQKNDQKKSSLDKTTSKSTGTADKSGVAKTDPTSSWTLYSNTDGQYSFRHPNTWLQASNPEMCTGGLALFASTTETLGKCATEFGGQMQFFSIGEDVRGSYGLTESYYTDKATVAVTIKGVSGQKLTATISGMADDVAVGTYPDGTKIVQYVFFTGGRTYVMSYVQEPSYPDVLSDFTLLVERTFSFSA